MATWDVARVEMQCFHCADPIGRGEVVRLAKHAPGRMICERCSIRIHAEPAPVHMPARTPLERLRDELRAEPDEPGAGVAAQHRAYRRLTATGRQSARTFRARITQARKAPEARKASAEARPFAPGSQPPIAPRGQGRTRHGVAGAIRESIDLDYRRRQAGERDE